MATVNLARLSGAPLLLLAIAGFDCSAHAGKGFILYGYGEHIADGGPLPQSLADEVDPDLRIGWKYGFFDLFWCNVWTWSGQYVLYRDRGSSWEFFELDDDAIEELRSAGAEASLKVPLDYTIPPAIPLAVTIGWLWSAVRKRSSS